MGGFSSPPPCPRPSSPHQNWEAVGAPGVLSPSGPRLLWGLSHPMTTRLPLRFLLESIYPAMTRLPLPLCWGLSRPGTTRPPRPLRGRSSRPETIRPPSHSVAAPPRVFLHSGVLVATLLPFHSVGLGVHYRSLAAARFSSHSPGLCTFPTPGPPPLRSPHGHPPLIPLCGAWGPLQKPCGC